jgi:type II secretory pathway component PulC
MKKLLDKFFKKKKVDLAQNQEDVNNSLPSTDEAMPDIPIDNIESNEKKMSEDSTGESQVFDMNSEAPKWRQWIDNSKETISLKIHALKFYLNSKKNHSFGLRGINRTQLAITWKDQLEFYWNKLKVEYWCHWIYQDQARKNINLATIVLIFVITSFGFGESIALLIKGVDQTEMNKVASIDLKIKNQESSSFDAIREADLFRAMQTINQTLQNKPKQLANVKCDKADTRTSLPVKLVNTVVLQDSVKSVASVQVRNSPAEQFREGEVLSSLAKIDKIERLKIILKNLESGECEFIDSEDTADNSSPITVMTPRRAQDFKKNNQKGIENEGNNFKISKKVLDDQLKDLAGLLTQARAIKIVNPDNSLSFKIVEIEPGGIFSTLGIQNEDTIKQIDGKPIDSMNQIMGLFSKLKTLNNLNLTIERGGSSQELNYSIK